MRSDDGHARELLDELDALDALEVEAAPLRSRVRRILRLWIIGLIGIVILAIGGGWGYVLSWALGFTALIGVTLLPRVRELRALERERRRLLLRSGRGHEGA